MNDISADILLVLPEIFLLSMVSLVLIVDLFLKDESRGVTYILSLITLFGTAFLVYNGFSNETVKGFSDTFVVDPFASILKFIILVVVGFVFVYAKDYLIDRNMYKGEFFTLSLFGTLGMMLMVSASNFLTVYLGLELLSLSMYALVAMQRDSSIASEAAMKYFVLGALASGMLLYGMSIIFGVTNSLDLAQINQA
ncbi:MAG: proton-conducting transporter membrane subunit, partial [Pseudomonadota bacterium]